MIRFQADADLHHPIVLSVRGREPAIDFASAYDSQLEGIDDPHVLEIAATESRIVVTHDRWTMVSYFRTRLMNGGSSPGIFLVSQFAPIGSVVEALVMVWAASDAAEWRNQARYLPSLSRHVFSR